MTWRGLAARWAWTGVLLAWAIVWALAHPAAWAGAQGAQTQSWLVASGVSPDATAENSQRKLVMHRARLFLAYARPVEGAPQVYLATSTDGGRTWQHARVSTSPAPSRLASLVVLCDGSVHVVWTQYAPVGEVRYRVLRAARWSDEGRLSLPGVYAGVPVVAPAAGNLHVLWYGIRPETPSVPTRHGSVYEILATSRGAARWSTPRVISPGVPDSINPALDAVTNGRLYAAWMQFDARHYQVRGAAFRGDWEAPRWLTSGPVERARVALAADGAAVHLVWEEGTGATRVMYAQLDGRTPAVISDSAPAEHPVIAASRGTVVAAWDEAQQVWLRTVRPMGPARVIGSGTRPMIATDGAIAYVAWTRAAGDVTELRLAAVRVR